VRGENEAQQKRRDESQNESVHRLKKEDRKEYYNKNDELGEKRSPQRTSYFDELDRRAKEGLGLKALLGAMGNLKSERAVESDFFSLREGANIPCV
jgi:hypothetical protein